MKQSPALPDWLLPTESALSAYVDLLSTTGVEHGLIGPREVPRLWERHVLNCAVVADPSNGLVPLGSRVADVGSGAGLPGLVWGIARPDIHVVLIEPLLRRATFLSQSVDDLGLTGRVTVLRGRAEDITSSTDWTPVDVVTARAVAPLEKLLGWTVPLLVEGGCLALLKGSSAAEEIASATPAALSMGVRDLGITTCGSPWVDPETTVVTGTRGTAQ
ncbi:MAG: 16S rRNA (guanine(527)-N(7))-methyltransferase RsmG [Candidatus Nanopelagicales bacterium]